MPENAAQPFTQTHVVHIREAAAGGDVTIMLLAAGVSRGVGGSLNYSPELLIREAAKFDGIPVMDNHQSEQEELTKPYRSIREWLANTKDVSYDPTPVDGAPQGGLVGKLDFIEPWFEDRVRRRPETTAFSIRASGQARNTVVGPNGAKIPDVESFQRVKSLDTVMKAGAGGRVLSIREAAQEEVMTLLTDATPDQLREALTLKIRESKIVGDYYTSEEEKSWKRKMAQAKADGDADKHSKLLNSIPAGAEHDRSECPMCQGLVGTQSKETEGDEMASADVEAIKAELVQMKEALAPLTQGMTMLQSLQAQMAAQQRTSRADALIASKVGTSGLPKPYQDYLTQEIRETALPDADADAVALIDAKIARFRSLAFGQQAGAAGAQVSGNGPTRVESKESALALALAAKLNNPNIPGPARRIGLADVSESDQARARRERREARRDNVVDAANA